VNSLARREIIKGSVAAAALAFSQNPLTLFEADEPEAGESLIL